MLVTKQSIKDLSRRLHCVLIGDLFEDYSVRLFEHLIALENTELQFDSKNALMSSVVEIGFIAASLINATARGCSSASII